MLAHVWFFGGLLAASVLFALTEIQIEGPEGWAAHLPTWRVENRWTRLFYSGKALTGYHLYVQLFVLVIVHLPFVLGFAGPSWRGEARILSFMVLFWIFEDFLWFVLNPAFGLRRFRREHIPWHAPTWWGFMPRDYWVFTPVGAGLYVWSWMA